MGDETTPSHAQRYLDEASTILTQLDADQLEAFVGRLVELRDRGGRLFVLGVGGSAANASHAVNDFRKLAGIEAYAPTDNVAELTARVNDDGWVSTFARWLEVSRLGPDDLVLVFSVGGGDRDRNISANIVAALELAVSVGASVAGIVGRDGGYTAAVADHCIVIPTARPEAVTPHTEAFQAVVWHLLVTHPALACAPGTWEQRSL